MNRAELEVVRRGADDWVMFLEVVVVVQQLADNVEDLGEIAAAWKAIALVVSLQTGGFVEVGSVDANGFTPWAMGAEALELRLRDEVRSLEPTGVVPMNAVCWLSNTELGDELARSNI
jgi:hypothetical protein